MRGLPTEAFVRFLGGGALDTSHSRNIRTRHNIIFRLYFFSLYVVLFERSEFLIATSKKKKSVRLCGCSTNLGFSVENTNLGDLGFSVENTNLSFSMGYVLCASYVCTWYQPADRSMVPGTYVQYRATSKSPQKSLRACAQTFCASNLRFTGENTNIRTYLVSARMYLVAG